MSTASYVHGTGGRPLIGQTIGAYFDDAVREHPMRDALVSVHQNVRWTYAELGAQVDALAAGLLAMGVKPGDRLGIWAPNRAEWTVTQFATAKAGIILVNINPAYRVSELEHVLRSVECNALVTATRFKSSDYISMIAELAPELANTHGPLAIARLPSLRHIITLADDPHPGCLRYADVVAAGGAADRAELDAATTQVRFDDAVNIQFTSGTTGLPKGATLSHHNLLNNGQYVGETTGIGPGDKLCIPVPLYHCFGMVMGNLACLTRGATMVYASEVFDPLAVLSAIDREQCGFVYGVPTMFIALLNHPEFARFDLSSLHGGIMAGAPCPIEVMKAVMNDMHMADITIAYGMTETSPISFQSRRDDPVALRVSTVGQVMPHVEVKIVDEAGRIVPRGETGELCTRGYSVMIGYWGDPEKTSEAIDAAGWMHTGDLATIDAQGYCRVVGRIKDMVIRGGENLYPREIEEYLHRLPDVQDVQVFGVPDPRFGEELCAWIIAREGASLSEETIRAFCQGQIAHYKVPRYIRLVDAFPTTATGKVQKFVMRDLMTQALSAQVEPA